jgi:hypothetical protein
MDFLHTTFTKILDEKSFKQELANTIGILNNNEIHFVKILFGVAWGNTYHDWTPFQVETTEINSEIKKAEALKVGRLGDDDFYIIIADFETEILFCHERDVHLSFNKYNSFVTDLTKSWETHDIIQTQRTKNGS